MKEKERIGRLEKKAEEQSKKIEMQQRCLRDKDNRINNLEKSLRNIKKYFGSFLILIPFFIIAMLIAIFLTSTITLFEEIPYDTETFSHNPIYIPYFIFGVVTFCFTLYFGFRFVWFQIWEEE